MLPIDYALEDYRILAVLGVGGFGITYVALDQTLQERVAIKEFLPAGVAEHEGDTVQPVSPSLCEKYHGLLADFIAESRNLARVRHHHVVRVRRCFKRNGTAYMVMDYEDGMDFRDYLQKLTCPPSETDLVRMLHPLLDGLQAVHATGLIHRDIKPQNIFIRHSDGSPVLLDFGAARSEDASHFTAILTAGYAPIEQYEEASHQGPWTDIYGLAAVLYRTITGAKPPAALNRMARDRLVPVGILCQGHYSDSFLRGIDCGLALSPDARPRTITEWRNGWLEAPAPSDTRRHAARPASQPADTDDDPTVPVRPPSDTPPSAPLPPPVAVTVAPPVHRAPPASAPPIAPPPDADLQAWRRAAAAHTIADYRHYLDTFAAGRFAEQARIAIEAIGELDPPESAHPAAPLPLPPPPPPRLIIMAPTEPDQDDAERAAARFDLARPSLSILAMLALFSFLEMVIGTVILNTMIHGNRLTGVGLATVLTFALTFAAAKASREVNSWSAIVWSGALTLGSALLFIVIFARYLV